MNMVTVDSSAIDALGYDSKTKKLRVEFPSKDIVYIFCNVPQELYDRFISHHHSIGEFYNQYIRDDPRYQCY